MIVPPPRGRIILRPPILVVRRKRMVIICIYPLLRFLFLFLQDLSDQPFTRLDHHIWLSRLLAIRVWTACIAMICLPPQIHPIQPSMCNTRPMKLYVILFTLPTCDLIDPNILHTLENEIVRKADHSRLPLLLPSLPPSLYHHQRQSSLLPIILQVVRGVRVKNGFDTMEMRYMKDPINISVIQMERRRVQSLWQLQHIPLLIIITILINININIMTIKI